MAIGNIFIRPQVLQRGNASSDFQITDEFIELASRFLKDAVADGPAREKIGLAIEQSLEDLKQELETRIDTTSDKIKDWFQPVIDTVKEGIDSTDGAGSIEGLVETLSAMLSLLEEAVKNLETADLEQKVNELGDIIENDLGLSLQKMTAFIKQVIDAVIEELSTDFLAGDSTTDAQNNFLIAGQIARLKNYLLDLLAKELPSFDRREIVAKFIAELKKIDWDEWIEKIVKLIGQGEKGVKGLSKLFGDSNNGTEASSATDRNVNAPFASRSFGRMIDHPQLSWYASWFEANRFESNFTEVEDRFNLADSSFAGKAAYKKLSPEFMEQWAHLSAVFREFTKATLHGVSIERKDYVSNLVNLILQANKGLFTLVAHDKKGEGWVTFFKLLDNFFFDHGLTLLGTTLSSFESWPGTGSAWAASTWLPDLGEAFLYTIWLENIREFTLSLFTLLNADSEAQPDTQNHEQVEGFILGFIEVGLWATAALPTLLWEERRHYGAKTEAIPYLGFGVLGSFMMALAGWGTAYGITGKAATNYWKVGWLKIFLHGLFRWPVYWYFIWDRNTDNGTFGLDNTGADGEIVTFPGYPNPETSPYKLPFPKDKIQQCVQSHHGVWSHHPKNNQIYAVDFGHHEGDEIVAMRGGTVVHYSDIVPDEQSEDPDSGYSIWNVIIIRHDDPSESTLPNPDHDKDHTGVTTTYAEYGHGRHYGVRHAFATKGIHHSKIKGTQVKQGELIMYAGDTGMSAYNHLHVHVITSTPQTWPPVTIPFVYNDVKHKIGKDGIPKAFNYYVSENENLNPLPEAARFHPERLEGNIVSAGQNYVEFDKYASTRDDEYKGAHILISFTDANQLYFQYKKIARYDADKKRAYIEEGWDTIIPPARSQFKMGAIKTYEQADDIFYKKFTYLAEQDEGGNAVNFPDSKPPNQLG